MKNLALVLLVACTGSSNYWITYTPAKGQTAQSKEAAIQHAVVAITDAKLEVESSADGIVMSKWFSGDGFASDANRFRIRVLFADGTYTVEALCDAKRPGSDWGGDCGDKRPRFVVETVGKVEAALK